MYDVIMAVDESISATGVAIFYGNELKETYEIKTSPKQDILSRFDHIYDELTAIADRHQVTVFVAEGVYESHTPKSILSFLYNRFIQGMLFAMHKTKENSLYALYYPSEWRSILGISGNDNRKNSKAADIAYVKDTLGIEVTSDNVADAICIGLAYIREWS